MSAVLSRGRRIRGWTAVRSTQRWLSTPTAKPAKEKEITFFASELAGCVRMHKFQPVHTAMEKLWEKHFPDSFNAAKGTLKEQGIIALTPDEQVQTAVESRGITEPVSKLKAEAAKATTTTEAVSIMTAGSASLAKTVDEQATTQAHAQMQSTSSDTDTRRAVDEELKSDRPMPEKLKRVEETIQHLPIEEKEAVVKPLRSAIEDGVNIQQNVRKDVFTQFGTRTERPALDIYAEKYNKIVRTDSKLYLKVIGETSTGQVVKLGGKVDGYAMEKGGSEEELVEIKNRMHNFFSSIPEYEQVQTQALLHVTLKSRGVLVQSRKTRTEHTLRATPFHPNVELLHKIVIPRAIAFARALLRIHQDEELALRVMKAGVDEDKALRERIVLELLRESSREQHRTA